MDRFAIISSYILSAILLSPLLLFCGLIFAALFGTQSVFPILMPVVELVEFIDRTKGFVFIVPQLILFGFLYRKILVTQDHKYVWPAGIAISSVILIVLMLLA